MWGTSSKNCAFPKKKNIRASKRRKWVFWVIFDCMREFIELNVTATLHNFFFLCYYKNNISVKINAAVKCVCACREVEINLLSIAHIHTHSHEILGLLSHLQVWRKFPTFLSLLARSFNMRLTHKNWVEIRRDFSFFLAPNRKGNELYLG